MQYLSVREYDEIPIHSSTDRDNRIDPSKIHAAFAANRAGASDSAKPVPRSRHRYLFLLHRYKNPDK